jgi:hypothetical protein
MKGDFSVLNFDPHEPARGVVTPAEGVLRNLQGVLFQQGRVMTDADHTEGELLDLGWEGQTGRDVIGADVCAVPADAPDGFRVTRGQVVGGEVQISLLPGRCWADGILTRLAGSLPNPNAAIIRRASYFGPPIANPAPTPGTIGDNVRDGVILEVSHDALHALQYPDRLIEPALGGPDTSERTYVNWRIRLFRLAEGEDCTTITDRLRDDPAGKGRLSVSLAPVVAIVGDCPVVGGGGYTGFEHALYRVEIADSRPGDPVRFKWSMWNGGLVGRGRFDATQSPNRIHMDSGRTAIVTSGVTDFYLEALQYDVLDGTWNVVYATQATLNTEHELELAAPPTFGALPSTTDPVFFRLWNGVAEVSAFTNAVAPVELRDGIRLVFDAPAAGNYRPGDYWTFKLRAGEIANPQVLIDAQPPTGIVMHRAPLAEINWTGRLDTALSGVIEDCRRRFRPLTNQKICCTYLVGNGTTSLGDFNSLEEAAAHLPAAGGELCLLPGVHRANLRLVGKARIRIHGCTWRSTVLPRTETRAQPILAFVDCTGIEVCDLDLITYDGIAVLAEGSKEDACSDVRIHRNRMIARTNAIRAVNVAELAIAENRLHLLDTVDGRATVAISADDVLVERNTLVLLPFVDETPDDETPDDDPTRNPADPCARPQILYQFPNLVLLYALRVWTIVVAQLVPPQPYRALGGIHIMHGSERVRLLENRIVGGAGNGVVLGGDIDPPPPPPPVEAPASTPTVNVTESGQLAALVQDEAGKEVADVDVYLEAKETATDRSDARGMTSMKAAPGAYALSVSPQYRVTRLAEARDRGTLVNVITIAPNTAPIAVRGFLHEITIDGNDISMMGLSGIGFALRHGASATTPLPAVPSNDAKAALLVYLDILILSLALTPLLRASDMVRDLVIRNNRIHHNLRNPFTQTLLNDAQSIGRGGVSLGVVESLVLAGNHIYENGPNAADPVCGVFVGYGNDLELTDNVLAANGATTGDFERNRRSGIRGGFYVRFAGALTTQLSTSTGRKPALRVLDNRVDQPAGRAFSVGAFGPVSVANNHLNSEFTGLYGFIDTVVGNMLLLNMGGIHRWLARTLAPFLGKIHDFAAVTELALPGGETMIDDNYLRLGLVNRSITSQVLMCFDDLGYASNTSAIYRSDPLFANGMIASDTLRATGSRLREDARFTISLLTMALRMNMTALNQADHCIVVVPQPSASGNPLPTVDHGNQVLNPGLCSRFNEPIEVWEFLVEVLQASANQLGGVLQPDAFSQAELADVGRAVPAKAVAAVGATQATAMKAYQFEAARVAQKHGSNHPMAVTLKAQADAGAKAAPLLVQTAETVAFQAPAAGEAQSCLSAKVINDRGQGLKDHTVELLRANGALVETVGRTDAAGFVTAIFDEARTAALAKEGDLFARVRDPSGPEVLLDKTAMRIAADTDVKLSLVVPLRVVPKSVIETGTVIFGKPTPEPAIRTPLDKLDIDEATKKRLIEGGIRDVEGIVETDPEKLGKIVGGIDRANRLIEMAKALLSGGPATRTPLDKLDIDEATKKRLIEGGIRDVEGIVETDPEKLAKIVGGIDRANRLIEMAKALLQGGAAAPGFDALGIDAATREKLEASGIRDVAELAAAGVARLARILGDRALATDLMQRARNLLDSTGPRPPLRSVRSRRRPTKR